MLNSKAKREGFYVVGLAHRTSNKFGKSIEDVSILWHEYYEKKIAEKIKNKMHENPVVLFTEYEADQDGRFTAVVGNAVKEVDDLPDDVDAFYVPAGNYIPFPAKGRAPKAIVETWKEIRAAYLPRVFTGDYEIYTGMTPESTSIDATIYVAVE